MVFATQILVRKNVMGYKWEVVNKTKNCRKVANSSKGRAGRTNVN